MVQYYCFTVREYRATLRSDPSALSGLRESGATASLFFFLTQTALPEIKALNLGVWGRAPSKLAAPCNGYA